MFWQLNIALASAQVEYIDGDWRNITLSGIKNWKYILAWQVYITLVPIQSTYIENSQRNITSKFKISEIFEAYIGIYEWNLKKYDLQRHDNFEDARLWAIYIEAAATKVTKIGNKWTSATQTRQIYSPRSNLHKNTCMLEAYIDENTVSNRIKTFELHYLDHCLWYWHCLGSIYWRQISLARQKMSNRFTFKHYILKISLFWKHTLIQANEIRPSAT